MFYSDLAETQTFNLKVNLLNDLLIVVHQQDAPCFNGFCCLHWAKVQVPKCDRFLL